MKYELFFRYRVSMMSDDRVIALCEQNGIEGIGIYTVLLAELRQHEGYRCAFASLPALARRWNVSPEKLQKIVCDFRLFRLYAEDESGRSFSSIYLDEEMNTEPDTPVRNRISTGTDRRESAATGTAVAGATTAGGMKVTVKRAANGRFTATRCKKKNILKEKEEEEIIRAAPEPPSVPITEPPRQPSPQRWETYVESAFGEQSWLEVQAMHSGMGFRFMELLPHIRTFFKQHIVTYGKEQTLFSIADAKSYFSNFIRRGSATRQALDTVLNRLEATERRADAYRFEQHDPLTGARSYCGEHIPDEAPPRPSENAVWSSESGKWTE